MKRTVSEENLRRAVSVAFDVIDNEAKNRRFGPAYRPHVFKALEDCIVRQVFKDAFDEEMNILNDLEKAYKEEAETTEAVEELEHQNEGKRDGKQKHH